MKRLSQAAANDPYSLTSQERRVVELLRAGKGTRQIAVVLGVSTRSTHTYVARILRKTETHHRLELLAKVPPWSAHSSLEDEIETVASRGAQ